MRVEIEPSEVEVDGVAEVLSVAVAGRHPLDPLDLAVDPRCQRIGHVARGGVHHALPVRADHAGYPLDRFQP